MDNDMATIINLSGVDDTKEGYKTYYVRIIYDDVAYYKIGKCKGCVTRRFAREPDTTIIEILNIWNHTTENKAFTHEHKMLEKDFKHGDRPFFGRCGPLTKKTMGNTEVFSHDVLNGEPAPFTYLVRIFYENMVTTYTTGYADNNPKEPWSWLYGEVRYMDFAFGPQDHDQGLIYQVPLLSHENTVTLATHDYLHDSHPDSNYFPSKIYSRPLTKKIAHHALDQSIIIYDWKDYYKMDFEGKEFKKPSWALLE